MGSFVRRVAAAKEVWDILDWSWRLGLVVTPLLLMVWSFIISLPGPAIAVVAMGGVGCVVLAFIGWQFTKEIIRDWREPLRLACDETTKYQRREWRLPLNEDMSPRIPVTDLSEEYEVQVVRFGVENRSRHTLSNVTLCIDRADHFLDAHFPIYLRAADTGRDHVTINPGTERMFDAFKFVVGSEVKFVERDKIFICKAPPKPSIWADTDSQVWHITVSCPELGPFKRVVRVNRVGRRFQVAVESANKTFLERWQERTTIQQPIFVLAPPPKRRSLFIGNSGSSTSSTIAGEVSYLSVLRDDEDA